MTGNSIANEVQRHFAEGALRRTVTLLQLPPDRELHQAAAHELREWCALTLKVYGMHPTVDDEVAIDIDEVGVIFVPNVTDLLQILIDLNTVLDTDDPRLDCLADDIAWLAHLAHLHLVRADLAGD